MVPVQNAALFYKACRKHKVPAEIHLYPLGPHGVGLASGYPELAGWPGKLEAWMKKRALLPAPR